MSLLVATGNSEIQFFFKHGNLGLLMQAFIKSLDLGNVHAKHYQIRALTFIYKPCYLLDSHIYLNFFMSTFV